MPLDSNLDKSKSVLSGTQAADDDWYPGLESRDKLGRHTFEHHPAVLTRPEAFDGGPLSLVEVLEL